MTEESIEEFAKRMMELESKATPGPWHVGTNKPWCVFPKISGRVGGPTSLADCTSYSGTHEDYTCDENAALIAESRTALPFFIKLAMKYREALQTIDHPEIWLEDGADNVVKLAAYVLSLDREDIEKME